MKIKDLQTLNAFMINFRDTLAKGIFIVESKINEEKLKELKREMKRRKKEEKKKGKNKPKKLKEIQNPIKNKK